MNDTVMTSSKFRKEKNEGQQKGQNKNKSKKRKNYINNQNYINESWRETTGEPKLTFWQKLFHLKPKKLVPNIIERNIHQIDHSHINVNALKVCKRLQEKGYKAYIVGGAVRDLLCHRIPKDFDVVTDATPGTIKKIFSNARIIGRRFKLVHIIFSNCIIETATFRATVDGDKITDLMRNNTFGTIEDDCLRRDFSINAMYYCPKKDIIIDYVGGYEDIKNKKIRVLKNPNISFTEDPVRMIRSVKYSKLLDCVLDHKTIRAIKKHAELIKTCSVARLHEEINKIYNTNKSSEIFNCFINYGIFPYLMPFFSSIFNKEIVARLGSLLHNADKFFADKQTSIEVYWAIILYMALDIEHTVIDSKNRWDAVKLLCHDMLSPSRVPNKVIDRAFLIFSLYTQMYNNGTLNLLQLIRRNNLAYEIFAFANATECKPIQEMFAGKVQIPNANRKSKKKKKRFNKNKQKEQNSQNEQSVQDKQKQNEKKPESEKKYKNKKCVTTKKSPEENEQTKQAT